MGLPWCTTDTLDDYGATVDDRSAQSEGAQKPNRQANTNSKQYKLREKRSTRITIKGFSMHHNLLQGSRVKYCTSGSEANKVRIQE